MIDAPPTKLWARYPWSVLLRLLLFIAPLLALLGYARVAAAHAAGQQHRGDTGLGLALLLGMVALVMLAGFFVDALWQMKRRRHWNWIIDLLILALLLMPFGWVGCNWFGVHESLACRLPINVFEIVIDALRL